MTWLPPCGTPQDQARITQAAHPAVPAPIPLIDLMGYNDDS